MQTIALSPFAYRLNDSIQPQFNHLHCHRIYTVQSGAAQCKTDETKMMEPKSQPICLDGL